MAATSGEWQQRSDYDAECPCGWAGATQSCDDYSDMTSVWTCPGCGAEHVEVPSDEDD